MYKVGDYIKNQRGIELIIEVLKDRYVYKTIVFDNPNLSRYIKGGNFTKASYAYRNSIILKGYNTPLWRAINED